MSTGNWMITSCVGARVTRPSAAPRCAPRWDEKPIMITWQLTTWHNMGRQTGGGRNTPVRPGGAWTEPSRDQWPGNTSCSLRQVLTIMCAGGQQRAPGSGVWTVARWGTDWPAGRSGRGTWGPCTGSGTSRGPSRKFGFVTGKSWNVSSFVPILTLPNWVPDSI